LCRLRGTVLKERQRCELRGSDKSFAQLMASDPASLADEFSQLAARKGVALPAKDQVGEKSMRQNARNFDREYMGKMAGDHAATVKLFQKQAPEGQDAELVAFGREHLPRLQHHLERSKDLQRLLK
jgi:putative membrane protein